MIKFILINDGSKIIENWHFFVPGFREILNHSDGEASEASILNDLYAGKLFMQAIFQDDKYVGFITGYVDEKPQAKKVLAITHMYLKIGITKDVFEAVQVEMDVFAEKYKCDLIRFYTQREKGFQFKLKEHGWKQSYVCFVKPIGGQDGREQK